MDDLRDVLKAVIAGLILECIKKVAELLFHHEDQ